MSIRRVEIKDFLVFKGEFAADFCTGVNVIIGGNGTGKTTLIKALYRLCGSSRYTYTEEHFFAVGRWHGAFTNRPFEYIRAETVVKDQVSRICVKSLQLRGFPGPEGVGDMTLVNGDWILYHPREYIDGFTKTCSEIYGDHLQDEVVFKSENYSETPAVYIPLVNMLPHAKGLLDLIDEYELSFDATQVDILRNAQRPATRGEKPNCKKVIGKLSEIIGGEVLYDNGYFFVKKKDGRKVEFSLEASGLARLSLLWKLLRNGLLESGCTLFWDEPENSLNPDIIPILADILLELSRNGVQIFLATHSELLASYFSVLRKNGDRVTYTSLYKDGEQIKANMNDRFDLLEPNNLTSAPVKLYERELEKGLGGNG